MADTVSNILLLDLSILVPWVRHRQCVSVFLPFED